MIGIRIYNNDVGFKSNRHRIDFLIDGLKITKNEVLFISEDELRSDSKNFMNANSYNYIELRKIPLQHPWTFIHNLKSVSKEGLWEAAWETIFRFKKITQYVVYNDFTYLSTVRNTVMRKHGCKTIFYIHSTNTADNFMPNPPIYAPYNTLDYDVLISPNKHVSDFYKKCGAKFGATHIVGNLWCSK